MTISSYHTPGGFLLSNNPLNEQLSAKGGKNKGHGSRRLYIVIFHLTTLLLVLTSFICATP